MNDFLKTLESLEKQAKDIRGYQTARQNLKCLQCGLKLKENTDGKREYCQGH
jgi:chromosome segregation ATPase